MDNGRFGSDEYKVQMGGSSVHDFETYYKITVIKRGISRRVNAKVNGTDWRVHKSSNSWQRCKGNSMNRG